MSEDLLSEDQVVIGVWARESLEAGLFKTSNGVAREIFEGKAVIHSMAYLPGIAWVMFCEWPEPYTQLKPKYMAFTHIDHRRQGHCRRLWEKLKGFRDETD